MSANVGDALLGLCLGSGLGLHGEREDSCVLPFIESRQQKFAKVPVSPGEIEAPDSHDDGCSCVEGNNHAFLTGSGGARIPIACRGRQTT